MSLRAAFVATCLAFVALAVPATASAGARADGDDAIVVLVGDANVPVGKIVEGVYVAAGDARIAGRVDGDVFVASGDVLVSGAIAGDLIVIDGTARLLRSARVDGDVHYGDERPEVSPFARVRGDVTEEDWTEGVDFLPLLGGFLIWLAVGVSFLILGPLLLLMAPRAADSLQARARERVGPTVAIGLAILIALPVAAFLAAVTVVGLPLALGLVLAMAPLGAVAYCVSAYALGRAMVREPRGRILAFLAGLAVLRALALVPVLGLIAGLAAVVFGLGLIGAAIGAARGPDEPEPAQPRIPGI